MNRVTTQEDLDTQVAGERTAVLFHATWCPYCREFVPVFDKLLQNGAGWKAVEAVVDDEDNPKWLTYDLEVVPTVVFFEGGKPVKRLDGVRGRGLDEGALRAAL